MSRKVLFILGGILLLVIGYLGYDYYMWSKYLEPDPSVSLYGWTDTQGVHHYTDRPLPKGARDIEITEGYKHRGPPLVLKAKEKLVGAFRKDSLKPKKKPASKK